jgi:hypothetical protein
VITRQFVQALEEIITAEIRLHERLMQATSKEYSAVLSLDSKHIETISGERLDIYPEIQRLEKVRREIVAKSLGESAENLRTRLQRSPIAPGVTIQDRNRLIKLVRDLRTRAVEVRKLSAELQSISGFGLEMVNGCISLFHAAKQVRNQVYSARGRIAESMTPRYSRSELIIRQA